MLKLMCNLVKHIYHDEPKPEVTLEGKRKHRIEAPQWSTVKSDLPPLTKEECAIVDEIIGSFLKKFEAETLAMLQL